MIQKPTSIFELEIQPVLQHRLREINDQNVDEIAIAIWKDQIFLNRALLGQNVMSPQKKVSISLVR